MARLHKVAKSRKEWKCCKCGKPIKKGDPYYHFQFYKRPRNERCMDCRPRRSELIASDKISRVVAAQEEAMDGLMGSGQTVEDAKEILQEMANEVEEVGQEYQESADSIREYFENSDTADDCEEKAGELEDWANRLRDWEPDDDEALEQDLEESGYLDEITDLVEDSPV